MCCITQTLSMALSIRLNDWQLLNVQRGSLTIYRNEGGMGSKSESTTFDSHWKSIESWVGTTNLVFCSGYNLSTFSKSTKEDLNMHGAWHSPNTLPTIVHCQTFRIITWKSPIKRKLPIWHLGMHWTALWSHGNLNQYSALFIRDLNINI